MRLTPAQRACEAVRHWDKYGEDALERMKLGLPQKGQKGFQVVYNFEDKGKTRDKLSEEFGVGKNSVQAARNLFLRDREKFERVAAGLEPLPKTIKDADGPYVYFIGHVGRSDLPIKIGKANSVRSRMSDLQTSHYTELEILFVIPGYSKLEKEIHTRYWQYHVRGEWFDLTPLQLDQIRLEYQGKRV